MRGSLNFFAQNLPVFLKLAGMLVYQSYWVAEAAGMYFSQFQGLEIQNQSVSKLTFP